MWNDGIGILKIKGKYWSGGAVDICSTLDDILHYFNKHPGLDRSRALGTDKRLNTDNMQCEWESVWMILNEKKKEQKAAMQ